MTLQAFNSRRLQGFSRKLQAFGIGTPPITTFVPYGICVDNDLVYVTDIQNDRVVIFDTVGTYVDEFGTSGNGNGQFTSPKDIHTDGSYLYILDNTRIIKHEFDGTFVASISAPSNAIRLSNTNSGVAVAYTASNRGYLKTYDYSLSYVRECYGDTFPFRGGYSFLHINSLTAAVFVIYTNLGSQSQTNFYNGTVSGLVDSSSFVGELSNNYQATMSNDGDLIYLISGSVLSKKLYTFNTTTTSPYTKTLKGTTSDSNINYVFFYEGELYCACYDPFSSSNSKIVVLNVADATTDREWTL